MEVRKTIRPRALSAFAFALLLADGVDSTTVRAQQAPQTPAVTSVGRSPNDIIRELESDATPKDSLITVPRLSDILKPWTDFKTRLAKEHGLNFGVAWTALYLTPTETLGDRHSAGGILELRGTWTLFGRGTDHPGTLGFHADYRHALGTRLAPQSFGPQVGSALPVALGFAETDFNLIELWWEQHFIKDRLAIRVGTMLPFAIYDYSRFKSPKTGFLNSTLNLNPTVAWPTFGLGIAGLVRPAPDIYIVAGLHDANAKRGRAGFDTFFERAEFFKVGEVGWDPKFSFGEGDYHATFWHVDRRSKLGIPSGWGFTLAAEQRIGEFVPFFRYGYSEGGPALLKHLVTGGIGFLNVFGESADVVGVGVSWARHTNRALNDQVSTEIFYRIQLAPQFALTPSVQILVDPPLNPANNVVGIFAIRGRIAF